MIMLIKNASVFLDGNFKKADIRTENTKIIEIEDTIEPKENETLVNGFGKMLLPSLVEIHSHGCVGEDFATSDQTGLKKMLRYYASKGILHVLATTVTEEPELTAKALRTIQMQIDEQTDDDNCATIAGVHMEGPFLSHNKRGAHDPKYLLGLSKDLMEQWKALAPGSIRLLSIDPDLEAADDFVRTYADEMVISIAHTECTYETAKKAIENGASHVTHLFNAMNGLNHREPGIVGAVSDFPVYAELICDGVHIHPAVIRLIYKVAGDRIVLISDSMSAAGMQDGAYQLGGLDVTVKDGKAVLKDGTIAGSSVNLYEMMCRAIRFGIPKEMAVMSATVLPARSVGLDDIMGSIRVQRQADMLLVDECWNIDSVFKSGKRIF